MKINRVTWILLAAIVAAIWAIQPSQIPEQILWDLYEPAWLLPGLWAACFVFRLMALAQFPCDPPAMSYEKGEEILWGTAFFCSFVPLVTLKLVHTLHGL